MSRTRAGRASVPATVDGLIGSVGIAPQYVALAQAGPHSGIWPVVAGRIAAVVVIAVVFVSSGARSRMPVRHALAAAAVALVCHLLATRQQLMIIAVVLSSLYPVIPVLLGIMALREHVSWPQAVGLVSAGLAGALATLRLFEHMFDS